MTSNPVTKVDIYTEHPYGSPEIDRLISLAETVLEAENWTFAVSVIIVDDAEIVKINRSFLSSNDITDVIAFQVDEAEGRGEVYINLDQAREQALDNGEPVQKAVARLIVHGVLHLGGWTDKTQTEREHMLTHGESYLESQPW